MIFSEVVRHLNTLALLALLILPACGGSSSSPSSPGPPSTTPGTGFGVSGVVFYDENANGLLDPDEVVRLPGATVNVGGRTGQAGADGLFTVAGVPAGSQTAQADGASLPSYYVPGAAVSVSIPQTNASSVAVPAVLDIGGNLPNHYLAFGDSITSGDGSGSSGGYLSYLTADLRSHLGDAFIANAGKPGTKSVEGEARLTRQLGRHDPAFTLTLYGTNDWNAAVCRTEFPCYTIDALRSMILQARDAGSNPILGTIPPANPAWLDKNATERNIWVDQMNDLVRSMARQEGVPIAEIHGDFLAQPSLRDLFFDHVHPNDSGYQIMARSWFDAITSSSSPAASGGMRTSGMAFGFDPPGGP